MFRCNLQGLGSAISSYLGGIFCQIFLYASRQPVVALPLDSLPTGFAPPPFGKFLARRLQCYVILLASSFSKIEGYLLSQPKHPSFLLTNNPPLFVVRTAYIREQLQTSTCLVSKRKLPATVGVT